MLWYWVLFLFDNVLVYVALCLFFLRVLCVLGMVGLFLLSSNAAWLCKERWQLYSVLENMSAHYLAQ